MVIVAKILFMEWLLLVVVLLVVQHQPHLPTLLLAVAVVAAVLILTREELVLQEVLVTQAHQSEQQVQAKVAQAVWVTAQVVGREIAKRRLSQQVAQVAQEFQQVAAAVEQVTALQQMQQAALVVQV
jgi:hypothetical protein